MERAEQDDELAESLRVALTIIDDCMNDYGLVRSLVRKRLLLKPVPSAERSTLHYLTMEAKTVSFPRLTSAVMRASH